MIDDAQAHRTPGRVNRLILCSGKIYVDLVSSSDREKNPAVAICRVEELYPFPQDDLSLVLNRYPNLEEVVWLQEEPENMGAWEFAGPLTPQADSGALAAALHRQRPQFQPRGRLVGQTCG